MLCAMKRSFSRRRSPLLLGLVTLLAGATIATGSLTADTSPATAAAPSWVRDYHYGFNGPHNEQKWGRYGWSHQPVGHGAMGVYKPGNVYTRNGMLILKTAYSNGQWTSAGVSGNPGFSAVGGKWEIRARMPVAKGIGYAFLLMPADGTWPPEVDIAEGRVNGHVEHFYHWGTPENHQRGMAVSKINTHEWHTYGVILEGNTVTFTIDGDRVVRRITNVPVTNKRLWLGFQTGAMDPNGEARAYETVDGGKPNSRTPASSEIRINWVKHYRR
jgi:beta-glucanase (GH16 family)